MIVRLVLPALLLAAAPAVAGDAEPHPSLAEVMTGATAMATMGSYLYVTKPDGAWVCAIEVSSKHFEAIVSKDDVVAEQTVPGAVCVPATHFKNLME